MCSQRYERYPFLEVLLYKSNYGTLSESGDEIFYLTKRNHKELPCSTSIKETNAVLDEFQIDDCNQPLVLTFRSLGSAALKERTKFITRALQFISSSDVGTM